MNEIELFGGNIITHMRHIADCKESRFSYFYQQSKLWKKLRKHLQNDDNGLIKHPENSSIVIHRGTGHAISFRDVYLYAKNHDTRPATEATVFSMSVEIEYVDDEYGGMDYPPTFTRKYDIQVPCELELNFSNETFSDWITFKIAEEKAETILKEQKELLKLMKLHPDFVKDNFTP